MRYILHEWERAFLTRARRRPCLRMRQERSTRSPAGGAKSMGDRTCCSTKSHRTKLASPGSGPGDSWSTNRSFPKALTGILPANDHQAVEFVRKAFQLVDDSLDCPSRSAPVTTGEPSAKLAGEGNRVGPGSSGKFRFRSRRLRPWVSAAFQLMPRRRSPERGKWLQRVPSAGSAWRHSRPCRQPDTVRDPL